MTRRIAPAAALLLVATLALAACTPPATAPTAWQQSVRTVADQASGGDYASALASLDALEAEVVSRRDAGEITASEADGILARIATVRADLTALGPVPTSAPQESAEPEPSETVEPAPSESTEPEPTETAEPTPDDPQDGAGDEEQPPSNGDDDPGRGNGGPGGKDDKKPTEGASPGPGKKDG